MANELGPPGEGENGQLAQPAGRDNATPNQREGYDAPYWTLLQTILWSVTGEYKAVIDAGDYGETCDRAAAAAVMKKWTNEWELSREEIKHAADELRRACLYGRVTGYDDDDRPIDVLAWRHLEIVLDAENVPFVRRRGEQPVTHAAYRDVVFPRDHALRSSIPLDWEDCDTAMGHIYNSHLWRDVVERARRAIFQELWIEKLDLTQTDNYLLRRYGAGAIDFSKSLMPGWFAWSEVLDPPFSPNSKSGLALAKARDQYQELAFQYAETVMWLNLNDINLNGVWQKPGELTRWYERTLGVLTEKLRLEFGGLQPARSESARVESLAPAKILNPVTAEDKKGNALNIAGAFVDKDGVAPNLKTHTTLVMRMLTRGPVEYRMPRPHVEALLDPEFKAARRRQGNPHLKTILSQPCAVEASAARR
jgi:hypothetical protein